MNNLRVCSKCLAAIESREGKQMTKVIIVDDDEECKCEWCEDDTCDTLYEFI